VKPKIPNRELVSRLVTADPEDPIWLEFIDRFHQNIRRMIYRAYRSEKNRVVDVDAGSVPELIEDLTQEVFVRLVKGDRRALARFQGLNEHSIFTYLSTIAVNLVRDHFKALRAQRKPRHGSSIQEPLRTSDGPLLKATLGDVLASPEPGPDTVAESIELRRRLRDAVDEASGDRSGRDRLIYRLYFVEGLTIEETAAIRAVGLSSSGVEKRVRKIRETIRKKFEEEGG
jgi:RNA polymerase sigma factor (sigma-70 family)